jgi:hypothetical protein
VSAVQAPPTQLISPSRMAMKASSPFSRNQMLAFQAPTSTSVFSGSGAIQ